MATDKFSKNMIGAELSTIGLDVNHGVIQEEWIDALRWPECNETFSKMSYDPVISSASAVIKAFARKVEYIVTVDSEEVTKEQQDQIDFIKSCMNDMESSFTDYVIEALSTLEYGYSVHEKVFKYRNQQGRFKSDYDDGKIGWAKLPVRSQDTIHKWYFDPKGRELLAVEQDLNLVNTGYNTDMPFSGFKDSKIQIPRKRFLLFRHNPKRNNPQGSSPLKSCYIPWKYKTQIEEFQSAGISRDLGGLPVIYLPPEYMSADADPDKKAVYEYYKNVIRNLHANQQAGLILPKFVDPETKADMFTFDLKSVDGGKMYDTTKIIDSYENKILMTYLADVLKLGQDASGSFALSDNKTNLLAVGIEALFEEILQEFNRDLIPQTLAMNGWSAKGDIPKIKVEQLDERDLDELSKFIQRTVSVGTVEVDQGLSDWIRKTMGAPKVDRSKPLDEKLLPQSNSRSGDGMKSAGEGTANKVGGSDKSTSNMENA